MKRPTTIITVLAILAVCLLARSTKASLTFVDDYRGDDTKGRFVMEAESYADRAFAPDGGWWEVDGASHEFIEGPSTGQVAPTATGGARENYMEVLGPTIGGIAPIDASYNGPFMDYRILVETTGSYRLYVRWRGRTGGTDSLYAYILKPDGTLLTGAGPNYFLFHQYRSNWIWDNRGVKNTVHCAGAGFPHSAVWTIAEPGVYTIRIAQRETETSLDALLFQTSNLSAPSGQGPPQSQLRGQLQALEITGPSEVAENHQTQYSAIAIYDNNTTADVTHLAQWSVEPNLIADIEAGLLATDKIFEPHAVTITAEYTEADITAEDAKEVSIFAICLEGTALEFDGYNDYVELGTISGTDDLALADSSFTICSWIKPNLTGDTWQRIVDKSNGTTGNNGYTFFVHTNGMIGVFIDWNDFRSDGSVITAGIWQHVAVTGDGSDYQLYVEGLPVSGLFLSGSYNSPPGVTTNMRIGMWNHSTAREFNGSIDDVRIYNRALSAEQIWANMHIPLEGDEPNLVACWNFDEGEGQVAYDLSPNANHGQLGSSPDIDNSDPAWVDSDVPIGICTPEGLVERNVNEALEIKLNILDEILEALAREDASVNILSDLFGEAQYGHLDKRDIIKAKQEIHSAIQGEEQAINSLEKSAGDLEDSLEALSGDDTSPETPPQGNSPPGRQSKTLTKPAPSDIRKPSRR